MAVYEISTDGFTAAIAALVVAFKKENPSVGEYRATCHDGTTVMFKFRDKPPKKRTAK